MILETTTQGIRISETVGGYLISRHYIGYPLREATALFKAEMKRLKIGVAE